jgi:hypothetical protein
MASFTKSYLDIAAEFEPSTAIPSFWGGQAKLVQRFQGGGKLSCNGLYGDNSIRIADAGKDFGADGDVIEAGGNVFAAGLTFDQTWNDNLRLLTTVSSTGNTFDRVTYFESEADTSFFRKTTEREHGVQPRLIIYGENDRKLTLGGMVRHVSFEDDVDRKPDTLKAYADTADSTGIHVVEDPSGYITAFQPDPSRETTAEWAAYVSGYSPLFSRLNLIAGLRIGGFSLASVWHIAPRLGLRYALSNNFDLTAAIGLQFQEHDISDYASHKKNLTLKSKRAMLTVGGFEWFLEKQQINLSGTLYYKRYAHILFDNYLLDHDSVYLFASSGLKNDGGEAQSYGFEAFIQKKLTEQLFYSAAYAFTRSKTRHSGIQNGAWFPSDFDFPHTLSLTGGYTFSLLQLPWYSKLRKSLLFKMFCWIIPLGDRMEFSAKFKFTSGRPVSRPLYDEIHRRWMIYPSEMNQERYPDYHSLDLRFERRLGYGWLHMVFYFDLQNAYDRDNLFMYIYNDETGKRTEATQLPFFPSGGFIIGF